ncbi:unnamed protein product [Adineta ricciae]|uniref:TIR domain-containing protein n=2 Tax=Adineta ricciae TaxID=249248 RepID=A0A813UV01_ADIRI|nr:unnamed protein product [Adineta ricciae]
MYSNFELLITELFTTTTSSKVVYQLNLILQEQIDESLSKFVAECFSCILTLESWTWRLLSQNSHQWIDESSYRELLYSLASFNKKLVYDYNGIEVDRKAALLFPVTVEQIKNIFQQIEQTKDDNDPFIFIVSLWFDNHSYFVHDNPHATKLSITDYINQYIVERYIMTRQFKSYLAELRRSDLSSTIFTAKMLFHVKTSLFSLFSYLGTKDHQYFYTADEMLRYLSNDYLQIVHVHHATVAQWNRDLSACIGHLTGVIAKCYWSDEKNGTNTKILFPTEEVTCNHVRELIQILSYEPFYEEIRPVRWNDETVLIDSILMVLLSIVKTQNINWFFRSNISIRETLLNVAENSAYDEICLRAYVVMGEVLTDEQLKELKITNSMAGFFFKMLEEAWQHPSKEYKQIPIQYLLRDFQILSKNDSIKQRTADLSKVQLLIQVSEQYQTVYDIFWTLSFNTDIQQQLRSNPFFTSQLLHLTRECEDKKLRQIVNGILWNLQVHQQSHPSPDISSQNTFDIMISYSHKDKSLCKQIYDELTRRNYRVWIDFDQMHGNIMDAMAEAIDRSRTVIICMSEEYRKSNFCRAEAHYAFQQQRHIVPVLTQKHYKPDGWLLFLLGPLLYVDFTEHELNVAIEMLLKELGANDVHQVDVQPVVSKDAAEVSLPSVPRTTTSITKPLSLDTERHSMLQWAQAEVQEWLTNHHLVQLCRLLSDCDGRSLVHLYRYMKGGERSVVMSLLQDDCIRRLNESISLIEISRFRSLMHQERWNK